MNRKTLSFLIVTLLICATSTALACEYKSKESKFVDYANCRYGDDSIMVVDLPEGAGWEQCVYYLQAFRPEKLLAITKEEDGVEEASINNRHQIGNPCYLSKQRCDAALKAYNEGSY